DYFGNENHRCDLAGVPTGFVTLRDDDVDADRLMAQRVVLSSGECGDEDAAIMRFGYQLRRRGAERARDQTDRVLERNVDERADTAADRHADTALRGERLDLVLRELGDLVLLHEL